MVVNTTKTNILCVSDSLSYTLSIYILDADENEIYGSKNEVTLLDFKFGPRPSPLYHVLKISTGFRKRFWTIFNPRNQQFSEAELMAVYKTFVRPVADYCDVVYHAMITDEQDELIENLQNHALKLIFGPGLSARKMKA